MDETKIDKKKIVNGNILVDAILCMLADRTTGEVKQEVIRLHEKAEKIWVDEMTESKVKSLK